MIAPMTYKEMSGELARVAHKRRTKAQREDYDFNVKREAELVRLLTSWGFQPVSEDGMIFTDGSVFAHVALAQNFRGEWVAQAYFVLSTESVKWYNRYALGMKPEKGGKKKIARRTTVQTTDSTDSLD